jgi:hypothetical protein
VTRAIRVERHGPGEAVAEPRPGDFILIRGRDWGSRLIRWAQRYGARGWARRDLAHWSHAALVTSFDGHIVEVGPRGVVLQHLSKYRACEYHYVAVAATVKQRVAAVRYARSCLGQPYARLGFAALALATLIGVPCVVPGGGRHHCVSLVARALREAGATFDRGPEAMTPADLAEHYRVTPDAFSPGAQTRPTCDEETIRWMPGYSR